MKQRSLTHICAAVDARSEYLPPTLFFLSKCDLYAKGFQFSAPPSPAPQRQTIHRGRMLNEAGRLSSFSSFSVLT